MSALIDRPIPYRSVVSADLVREVMWLESLTAGELATTPVVLSGASRKGDGLLSLVGVGRGLWAGEDAQAYVDRLRSEWR